MSPETGLTTFEKREQETNTSNRWPFFLRNHAILRNFGYAFIQVFQGGPCENYFQKSLEVEKKSLCLF